MSVARVSAYSSHLVFKSESIVVGAQTTQDTVYALVTVRMTDRLRLPLFLKNFTATLTTSDGAETEPVSAVQKPDLPQVFATFPAVAKLASAQGSPPLYRETRIEPGETVEGWVLLEFPVDGKRWNERRSATLTIDLYHQPALRVAIPASAPVVTGEDDTPQGGGGAAKRAAAGRERAKQAR